MTRLSITLEQETYDDLVRLAAAEDRSVAAQASRLVRQGLLVPVGLLTEHRVKGKTATLEDLPIGGQDAAAGKGVEARGERTRPNSTVPAATCFHPLARRTNEYGKGTQGCSACGASGLEKLG